jgi:hypothetical protein
MDGERDSTMPEPMGEDRQVKFLFEYDPGYRVIAANGMWGGITPRGDMRLDFFVESLGVPDHVTHLITPDQHLGPELNRSQPEGIVRRVQVGVLLSLDQGDSIADFIKQKIAERKRTSKEKE